MLVENDRRAVLAAFGLAPGMLRRCFPRPVITSISSQGEDEPELSRTTNTVRGSGHGRRAREG
ncbi:hypothetical protein [Muricoccus radiodurans]|uniref:hypothetical protein n=1 Tax=Muricoccus radiodurans TaxID=2231721 RepID=UPI003CECD4CC